MKPGKLFYGSSMLYVVFHSLTMELFSESAEGYFFYLLILILGNYIFSCTIKNGKLRSYKYIVFLIINIAYFVKFYAIVYVTQIERNSIYEAILLGGKLPEYMSLPLLYDAYSKFTVMYLITAMAFLCADKVKLNIRNYKNTLIFRARALFALIMLVVFIFVMSTVLRLLFKETAIEPISVVLNTYLVPLLFIFMIVGSINSTNYHWAKALAITFVISGLLQFSVFGSKLYIILPFIWVVVIQSVSKFTLIKPAYFLLSPFALLAYPLFNFYREALYANNGVNLFLQVIERLNASDANFLSLAFFSLLHRFIGVDSFVVLLQARDSIYSTLSIIDVALMSKSIAYIITYDILSYKYEMGISTSIFGELYFLAGNLIMASGLLFIFTFLSCIFIRLLLERNSVFSKSLGIYFIVFFSLYFNEGVILSSLKYQAFTILSFLIMYKFFFKRIRVKALVVAL
ncbi:hypothetical protein N9Q31_02800 [Pseudomonadales bacterium]|nr:hypothetical protein [Pseudomonadales bacterium]